MSKLLNATYILLIVVNILMLTTSFALSWMGTYSWMHFATDVAFSVIMLVCGRHFYLKLKKPQKGT